MSAYDSGEKTVTASLTTSDLDGNPANNNDSLTTTVIGPPGTTEVYSTGNIAVGIPDSGSVDVPIDVPDAGTILEVESRVRLDHSYDGDLAISLVSPTGTIVDLSSRNGGSGNNYGVGANDCTGTPTEFDDDATTSITAGAAPFAGSFRPEQLQGDNAGDEQQGEWVLRIADLSGGDFGWVGCVQLAITREN